MIVTAVTPQESSPPPDNSEAHVQNYGDLESTCRRWTDQCRTCSRSPGGDPVCSNIGISCQPAAVQCLERNPEESHSPEETK
jgi:hypothetical protein